MSDKKLFISASNNSLDMELAQSFYDKFEKGGLTPFLAANTIYIGEKWAQRIDEELNQSDYFLLILSKSALMSDMVIEEVRRAKFIAESRQKTINIFPVRVNLPKDAELNYDLGGYLNRIQQRTWTCHEDTGVIVDEILTSIQSGNNATIADTYEEIDQDSGISEIPIPSVPLEKPEGAVSLDSPYYIERAGEADFKNQLLNSGSLLRIKGPRQFGKTSLLARVIEFGKEYDYEVIPLNLQQFNAHTLQSLDSLLVQICKLTARKLKLADKLSDYWLEFMDIKNRTTNYFDEYLLEHASRPVLIAIDEADRIFSYPDISSDFFSLLRVWHENSKIDRLWGNLRIAISYSTEGYLAIPDIHHSPFNVGDTNELSEFTEEEIANLAYMHNFPLPLFKIQRLKQLVGGHPYLIKLALYLLAKREYSFDKLVKEAPKDNGPFGDHLKSKHWNLTYNPDNIRVMREIMQTGCSNETLICDKLKAAGLVKGSTPDVDITSEIYKKYFKRNL